MHPGVKSAFDTALRDFHSCFTDHGILAGRKHLCFYKARNAMFASLGANAIGEFTVSWKSIELFLSNQRKDGLIPHRITAKLKPHFHHIVSEPRDGNALVIIALRDYFEKAGDMPFLEKHFEAAAKAMAWLKAQDSDRDLLVEEPFLANWQETVLKEGKVLYTNCLYYQALKDFSEIANAVGNERQADEHRKMATRVKDQINAKFWFGNYYLDWIGAIKHSTFSTAGNVLAVLSGLADREQSQMIENKIKQHQLNKVPLQANYPVYPFWRIPPSLFPVEAYNYHNGSSWPWIGCLNAIALNEMDLRKEAKHELKSMARLINENGSVHEVFLNGKPIKSWFLKSEPFFSWNSGLFLKAVKETSRE